MAAISVLSNRSFLVLAIVATVILSMAAPCFCASEEEDDDRFSKPFEVPKATVYKVEGDGITVSTGFNTQSKILFRGRLLKVTLETGEPISLDDIEEGRIVDIKGDAGALKITALKEDHNEE
ncbi:hypothetical protein GF413_00960 [Candidatus Micrarchaeota archaeon]|nr:hypothetical protein [Candidatus Micrarchaeota archaeon]